MAYSTVNFAFFCFVSEQHTINTFSMIVCRILYMFVFVPEIESWPTLHKQKARILLITVVLFMYCLFYDIIISVITASNSRMISE